MIREADNISNPSTEHIVPGVDYVKQRVFSIPLQLPIQTGCRRRAHTLCEGCDLICTPKGWVRLCNLKRATRTPFNVLDHYLISTVVLDLRFFVIRRTERLFDK